jgi:hypothetical protein
VPERLKHSPVSAWLFLRRVVTLVGSLLVAEGSLLEMG